MATTYYPTTIKYGGTNCTSVKVGSTPVLSPTVTLTIRQYATINSSSPYGTSTIIHFQANLSSALKFPVTVNVTTIGGESTSYTTRTHTITINAGFTLGSTPSYIYSTGLNIYSYSVTSAITQAKIGGVTASTSSVTSATITSVTASNTVIAKANIYLNKIKYVQ